ncbi:hypothetical protein [uncultured Campylobacter sp.]|uniref:hypothetical protein n=1 Tax=uncultured Campylobacter sp. TaxID=218934 RepID=UPI0025E6EEF3|nr:hypothetical protein [uncultured Campylobacter sp.]
MSLSAKGYVCPAADGVQVVGATYDRNLFVSQTRASDDEKNLDDVAEFLDGKFSVFRTEQNLAKFEHGSDTRKPKSETEIYASERERMCKFEPLRGGVNLKRLKFSDDVNLGLFGCGKK